MEMAPHSPRPPLYVIAIFAAIAFLVSLLGARTAAKASGDERRAAEREKFRMASVLDSLNQPSLQQVLAASPSRSKVESELLRDEIIKRSAGVETEIDWLTEDSDSFSERRMEIGDQIGALAEIPPKPSQAGFEKPDVLLQLDDFRENGAQIMKEIHDLDKHLSIPVSPEEAAKVNHRRRELNSRAKELRIPDDSTLQKAATALQKWREQWLKDLGISPSLQP